MRFEKGKNIKNIEKTFSQFINLNGNGSIINNYEWLANLNYIEFSSPEPRNQNIEKRSKIINWFSQALYFSNFKRRRFKN